MVGLSTMDASDKNSIAVTYKNAAIKSILFDFILLMIYMFINSALIAKLNWSAKSSDEDPCLVPYEVLSIILPWIPGLVFSTSRELRNYLHILEIQNWVVNQIFYLLLFPVFIFISLLRNHENNKVFVCLQTFSCASQIITSSLHLVLVIFMTLRGVLSDGEDHVTYILVAASAIISVTMYLKGSIPLLKGIENTICLLPWLTSRLLFRASAYAYIMTFLGYWAAIPLTVYTLLLVTHQVWKDVERQFLSKNDGLMVKGPYAVIWTGSNWRRKYLHNQYKVSDQLPSTEMSAFAKSIVRILSPVIVDDWQLPPGFGLVEHLILLLTIGIIVLIVNYVNTFQYAMNILDYDSFMLLSLCIVCFGITAPCSLLLTKNNSISLKLIMNTLSILLIGAIITIASLICHKILVSKSKSECVLFSIDKNATSSFVNVLGHIQSTCELIEGGYANTDVFLNFECNDTLVEDFDYSLFIMDLENIRCLDLINSHNITQPVFDVSNSKKLRNSSPLWKKKNLFFVKSNNVSDTKQTLNSFVDVFVSNKSYTSSLNEKIGGLKCSDKSLNVEISKHKMNISCVPFKFIANINAWIYQQFCLNIFGFKQKLVKQCFEFNSSHIPTSNNLVLKANTINSDGKEYKSCCLETSYVVQSYGKCNRFDKQFLGLVKFNERGICLKDFSFWNYGFYYLNDCLFRIEYKSLCDQLHVKIPSCYGVQC